MIDQPINPVPDYFRDLNTAKKEAREHAFNPEKKLGGPVDIMSRRDHFAAAALQGILSFTDKMSPIATAETAAAYGDALLKKLEEAPHD